MKGTIREIYKFISENKNIYNGQDIRNVKDHNEIYWITKNGCLSAEIINKDDYSRLKLEDFDPNTIYEQYSDVQIIDGGYFEFDRSMSSYKEVLKTLGDLHDYIDFREQEDRNKGGKLEFALCGGSAWNNGLLDSSFAFYNELGFEVKIFAIPFLCEENIRRKKRGLPPIPFDKNMKKDNAIFISLVSNVKRDNIEQASYGKLFELLPKGSYKRTLTRNLHY